ncbi:glomulin-like isoform X1 [Mytilus californianus]|uniref:glomulin-like isoform X1 n=1 Tax=Mytilus californianus TaxID=6549 RepID=UPI002247FD7A|nr:glomulin-like isoform X1 [Mytilus californianus]
MDTTDFDMYGGDLEAGSVLENIKESLKYKDAQSLKMFILERKLSDESIFYELAGELAKSLTEENSKNAPIFFEACERCMNYIVKRGNPKELIIALLEQMDTFKDDEKFKALLVYIQQTLMKLPSKRTESLEITLETVHAHVIELPTPADHQLEKDERKLLELDRDVRRITDVILAYLEFLQPFVKEVSLKNPDADREKGKKQIGMLMDRLLSMLDHPLMFLDLVFHRKQMEDQEKTYGRVCTEQLVELITELCPDLFKMLQNGQLPKKKKSAKKLKEPYKAEDDTSDEDTGTFGNVVEGELVSEYSYACLSYLIFREDLAVDSIPFIYRHPHILQSSLHYILLLLKADHSLVKFKGVYLLQSLMGKIPVTTLSLNDLDNDKYKQVVNALIDIMIQNPVKELRQECVQLYRIFICMFCLPARYKIYEMVLNTCPHAGLVGYTIQLLKDQIDSVLKNKLDDLTFFGANLYKLLKIVAIVEEGATQDILQISDRVIALLNCFRYLLLRDPPGENVTKIWDFIGQIEKHFFEPLRLALDLSKGHYQLDLQDLKDGQKKDKGGNVDLGLTVGGVAMPRVPVSQQVQIVESALNTFDVIDSILCRITEITEMQRKTTK